MCYTVVKAVQPGSIAADAGVAAGDALIAIDGTPVLDVLDFKFRTSVDYYTVTIQKADGSTEEIEIDNPEYEAFGAEFEHQLMDKPKLCQNKCVFCFMDQLPKHMRHTMYVKDDDYRLSFLQGNYVTLTNLSKEDIRRLIRMRVSPVNISVHTTDPALRVQMLKNPHAGNLYDIMREFAENNITMNAQIVLCHKINDGDALLHTICDLRALYPHVQSISAVPVGLTKYRETLTPLTGFDAGSCADVISMVEQLQQAYLSEIGTRLIYLADEFYIQAKRPLPPYEAYEDFLQIENGVGMMAAFEKEFYDALAVFESKRCSFTPKVIATSVIAYDFIKRYVDAVKDKAPGLDVQVMCVKNNFFGPRITVTGLLCGQDIIDQLTGKLLSQTLVLSSSMIKEGTDLFLDDVRISDVERALGVRVVLCENDGAAFLRRLTE